MEGFFRNYENLEIADIHSVKKLPIVNFLLIDTLTISSLNSSAQLN